MVEPTAVETTSALLESGAIMLGTALIFVTLFRKLGLDRVGFGRGPAANQVSPAGQIS